MNIIGSFEEQPGPDYNLKFPAGDISFADMANSTAVLEELKYGDFETQRAAVLDMRESEVVNWRFTPGQEENFNALEHLTKTWADATAPEYRGKDLAAVGAFSTLAFIQRSEIIPVEFIDMSHELEVMSEFDEDEIMDFARSAWPNMGRSHKYLMNELLSFVMHLETIHEIRTDEDESARLLMAGAAAIPYLMANTSGQIGDLNDYLKDEKLFIKQPGR